MKHEELNYNKKNNKIGINYVTNIKENNIKINSTKDAALVFTSLFAHQDNAFKNEEHLWVIAIDKDNYVCQTYLAATGIENIKLLNTADLFKIAINYDCDKIILGHNQTKNGKLTVDEHQLDYTSKIYQQARILGIDVYDHIIINTESITSQNPVYYSYKENYFIDFIAQDPTYQTVKEASAELQREQEDCYKDGRDDKAKEIVLNLLKKNFDLITIMDYTMLPMETVEDIAEGGIA